MYKSGIFDALYFLVKIKKLCESEKFVQTIGLSSFIKISQIEYVLFISKIYPYIFLRVEFLLDVVCKKFGMKFL